MFIFILFALKLFCLAPSSSLAQITPQLDCPHHSLEQIYKQTSFGLSSHPDIPLYPFVRAWPVADRTLPHHRNLLDANGFINHPIFLPACQLLIWFWEYYFNSINKLLEDSDYEDPYEALKKISKLVGQCLRVRFSNPHAHSSQIYRAFEDPNLPEFPEIPEFLRDYIMFVDDGSTYSWVFKIRLDIDIAFKLPNFRSILHEDYAQSYLESFTFLFDSLQREPSSNSIVEIAHPVNSGIFFPVRSPRTRPCIQGLTLSKLTKHSLIFLPKNAFLTLHGAISITDFITGSELLYPPTPASLAESLPLYYSCLRYYKKFNWISFDFRSRNLIIVDSKQSRDPYRHCHASLIDYGNLFYLPIQNSIDPRLTFVYGLLDYISYCTTFNRRGMERLLYPFFFAMTAFKDPSEFKRDTHYTSLKLHFLQSFSPEFAPYQQEIADLASTLFQILEGNRRLFHKLGTDTIALAHSLQLSSVPLLPFYATLNGQPLPENSSQTSDKNLRSRPLPVPVNHRAKKTSLHPSPIPDKNLRSHPLPVPVTHRAKNPPLHPSHPLLVTHRAKTSPLSSSQIPYENLPSHPLLVIHRAKNLPFHPSQIPDKSLPSHPLLVTHRAKNPPLHPSHINPSSPPSDSCTVSPSLTFCKNPAFLNTDSPSTSSSLTSCANPAFLTTDSPSVSPSLTSCENPAFLNTDSPSVSPLPSPSPTFCTNPAFLNIDPPSALPSVRSKPRLGPSPRFRRKLFRRFPFPVLPKLSSLPSKAIPHFPWFSTRKQSTSPRKSYSYSA